MTRPEHMTRLELWNEVDRLRAALEKIADMDPDNRHLSIRQVQDIAIVALEQEVVEEDGPKHLAWSGALSHPGDQKTCPICHEQSAGKSAAEQSVTEGKR